MDFKAKARQKVAHLNILGRKLQCWLHHSHEVPQCSTVGPGDCHVDVFRTFASCVRADRNHAAVVHKPAWPGRVVDGGRADVRAKSPQSSLNGQERKPGKLRTAGHPQLLRTVCHVYDMDYMTGISRVRGLCIIHYDIKLFAVRSDNLILKSTQPMPYFGKDRKNYRMWRRHSWRAWMEHLQDAAPKLLFLLRESTGGL